MRTGRHSSLFLHPGACSPYAPPAAPTPEQLSSTAVRMPIAMENALNSQISCPPPPGTHLSRRHIPLPPTIQGQAELNPLLSSEHVLIRYRLVAPPIAASVSGSNDCWMLEAATCPHLRSMTITTSDAIPWPVIVHASSINPLFVTVGDVLTAVHDALHIPATEYERRLVLLPNTVVGNHCRNVMRRLSLFNGRHWWAGLSKSPEGPEIWNLHLQRAKRNVLVRDEGRSI